MLSLIAVIIFPYIAFVFFGESFNPIFKPTAHSRRAIWKYGRAMASAVFLGTVVSLILFNVGNQSLQIAGVSGMSVSLLLGLFISARKLAGLMRF
ncbi:MAG: hypothetical protein AB8B97_01040 [Granulosicoccus sp.]